MKQFQIYIRLNPQATSESFFLAPVKEVSETLIYSKNPIKKKNIESFLNESSNIDSFQKNFLREFTFFNFDAVFSHVCSQSKFFENLSPLLFPFPQPHCFIFSGLEDSGKTFSLLGDENSLTGILPSFIENIFDETKMCYISAYRLYKNKLRDLGEENETFFRRELRKEESWKDSLASLRKRSKFFGGYHCLIVLESFVKGRTTKTLFVRLADFTSQLEEEIRNLKKFIEEGNSTDSSLISSIIELMEDKIDKYIWTINLECNPLDLTSSQQLLNIFTSQKNNSERKAKPPLSPKFEMASKRKYDEGLPKNVFSTYRSNFREKQEILSREVSAIKERFSQKKAYLESIVPKTIRNTPKIENSSKETERHSSLESDIQRLKQEIISKIENQKAKEFSPTPSSEELPQKYDNSLNILKSALTEKEVLDKQKIHHLKKLNEELKESLKNYIISNDNLNNEMQKADDHIISLEERINSAEGLIEQHHNAERKLKENEGHLLRTIDDYKKKTTETENKLGSKREKLRKVRMDFDEYKRENGGEIELIRKMMANEKEKNSELTDLLKSLESKNIELSTHFDSVNSNFLLISRENEELKVQLDCLKEENFKNKSDLGRLGDIHQEITQNFALLQVKYEDLKESAKGLEAKILKNKNKFDQEKQALSSDLSQKISKKKTKLKSFKEKILEMDEINKNLNFENNELKRKIEEEIGKLKAIKGEVDVKKGELNETKTKIEETERNKEILRAEKEDIEIALLNERNEKNNLFSENEKLKKILKNSERKLSDLESILEKQANSLASLKDELNNNSMEKNEYKSKFEKISFEYENLIQQHNQDSDLVESKLSQLIRDLKQKSEENKDLTKKENELKKEIIFSQENAQRNKEKYIKLKLANKTLKSHLLELEAKMKEFILERQMEMREVEEARDNREKNVNSKMKILDDIQNLVRTYRTRKV